MASFNPIKEIFVSSPRNIKRRLFRDIFLILLFTISGIITLTYIEGRSIKHELSTQVISDSVTLIRDRFLDFTRPVENNLQIISQWGKSEQLSLATPDATIRLLTPLLEVYTEISSLTLVDENGQKLILTKNDSIINSTLQNKSPQPLTTLPWYEGARQMPGSQQVYWSRMFVDSNLQQKAITASIAWFSTEGKVAGVAAFTITIKSLTDIVEELKIPKELEIIFLDKNGLAYSRLGSTEAADGQDESSHKKASEHAVKYWQEHDHMVSPSIFFRINTKGWWASFSQLRTGVDINWLGIIMPEAFIMEDVQDRWIKIMTIAGAIFLAGLIMTVFLVRKYSSQLKDLPQQAIKQSSFIEDIKTLVRAGESSNIEFKSTMRTNLNSGKAGKEIELAWLKTVSAFMNSDGGTILLGIKDNGDILGIEADNFKNDDKCLLHCKSLLSTHIGAEFTRYIHTKIGTVDDKDVVSIECERVRRPVFLKVGKNEDFYIRSGPSSIKLTMSQMVKYLNER